MSEQILSIAAISLSVLDACIKCNAQHIDYSHAVCPYPVDSVSAQQWHLEFARYVQFIRMLGGESSTWADTPRVCELAAAGDGGYA